MEETVNMNKWKRKLKALVRKKPFAFFDIFLYHTLHNDLFQHAAGLSYFLILAIFPFFIALLNIVSYVNVDYLNKVFEGVNQLPPSVKDIILNFLRDLQLNSSSTLLSISLIGSIFIASKGIKQVIRIINDVLNLTEDRNIVSLMVLAFFMTIALFALIILIFATQVVGSNILEFIFNLLKFPPRTYRLINFLMNLIPLVFMFISFFFLYYLAPKWPEGYKSSKRITAISAAFTTLVIILATQGFGYYVSNFSSYSNTYGSLAGMIIFLVWLYLFGLMLLFGGALQATLYTIQNSGTSWPRKETLFDGVVSRHERIC